MRESAITIDYPEEGSIFPPEITAPTFLWHDAAEKATAWLIEVTFADGAPAIRVTAPGERMRIGEIDTRCVSENNELPRLTPYQASARTWTPDAETWAAIKKHSVATISISGNSGSRGRVMIWCARRSMKPPMFC